LKVLHLHYFSKIRSQKESQNSRIQGFSYYFCMMIEGSGSGSRAEENNLGQFSRILEHFTQKFVTTLKIWGWDPGSGSRVKKAPDPGSGSATLKKTKNLPLVEEVYLIPGSG
jgi:hypothetical protein